MPSNIEIKARAHDFARQYELAKRLSDTPARVIHQHDVFFKAERGRLKLRILGPESGELIFYERPDQPGPKASQYLIARTSEPEALRATLAAALGLVGEVIKRRTLFMAGQTRIHLDEVAGLGEFLELEVAMKPEQSPAEGVAIAQALMRQLAIADSDLIDRAYVDLMTGTKA